MKQLKLYIKIPGSITLLNANKVRSLKDTLPNKEAIEIHLEMERIKALKHKDYKPVPLRIRIDRDKFNEIMEELRIKQKNIQMDEIKLVSQSNALPICIIYC